MQVNPWLERRLRLAVSAAATVPGAASDADDARVAEALAKVPRPVLQRMLALADADDDAAAAMLEADPELMLAVEGLMGHEDA